MSMNVNNSKETKLSTFFHPETGMISPEFKHQLDLVGLVAEKYFPQGYHIYNVYEVLNKHCFQKDNDFYKKGGISTLNVSLDQAEKFLDDCYAKRENIMPRKKVEADGIIPPGIFTTLKKRLNSLKEAISQGYNFKTLHFIASNQEHREAIEKLIKENHDFFEGRTVKIENVEIELNSMEKGIAQLVEKNALAERYAIITDFLMASKAELIAKNAIKSDKYTCIGIACVPTKDWRNEMSLYNYSDPVPWALSALNFKTRQVDTELRAYKTTHIK